MHSCSRCKLSDCIGHGSYWTASLTKDWILLEKRV